MGRPDWNVYGFVAAGSYRRKVVLSLMARPKTPVEIVNETGLYISHVSRTLRELRDKGVVELLSPALRRGRLFGLTKVGTQVSHYLKSEGQKS